MREIKYQGWNGKKLCEVRQIQFDADGETIFWYPVERYPNLFYQDCEEYPLRIFTGLKDCKGKEIYEGDIIRYGTEEDVLTAEVGYQDEDNGDRFFPGFIPNVIKIEDFPEAGESGWGDDYPLEVIGNIYEHDINKLTGQADQ